MAEVEVVVKASCPEAGVMVVPTSGVAALVAPKPENNDGAAAPSFLSVVGAGAAIPVGWPPREKAGRVTDGI